MQKVAPSYHGRAGLMQPSKNRRVWRWGNEFFVGFAFYLETYPKGIADFEAKRGSLDCIIWFQCNWEHIKASISFILERFETLDVRITQPFHRLLRGMGVWRCPSTENVKYYYTLYYEVSLLVVTSLQWIYGEILFRDSIRMATHKW